MKNYHQDNSGWAQVNGYKFHAESKGPISEGARGLDIFRGAGSFRNHVHGIYRNRQFEIFDIRKEVKRRGSFGFVDQTVVLISATGLKLPNFDLLPRRDMMALRIVGIKGLDLKMDESASPHERAMVDAFNRNYGIFAGGAFEAMEASITSNDRLVPSLSEMASVCKPSVLQFLSTASSGFIEVQNGYLAVHAPETRIITSAFNDTLLQGSERESLLAVANDLLDVLTKASRETPLSGLTLENKFRPASFLGSIIGIVIGFFLGSFVGILLLFLLGKGYFLLFPVLVLGGMLLGRFIGKALTMAK